MEAIFGTFMLTGLVVVAIAGLIALALLPIFVAKQRQHPSMEAVTVCCIVGWLVWPAWCVALVWAYMAPLPPRRAFPIVQNPRSVTPIKKPDGYTGAKSLNFPD